MFYVFDIQLYWMISAVLTNFLNSNCVQNIIVNLPSPVKNILKKSLYWTRSNLQYRSTPKMYCPYCGNWSHFLPFGNPSRPMALCPHCESLERHRGLYNIYQEIFLHRVDPLNTYHMAPERCIYDLITKYENINYITGDLNPSNYSFAKNCKLVDVTNMPFPNGYFDIILSNHVMEHIPDENKFLEEMDRVLKSSGTIILTVPFFKELEFTLEDPQINTPELRLQYYGQEDHVRKYGRDISTKLEKYFSVTYVDDPNGDGLGNGGYFILTKKSY